ncbi:ABC transporter substrate-binding protein [Kaistia dalseonensis]|uniref:Thiamine pyrimidine synthase n=1 Tax=Kaistia dalseonensis TaxID=410840 RepID=A0ABU0HAI2_9HYPH|nr:ABC transporter substrate-binding protein [Kaistia dalseonensis]MCX5496697.1 ABC transporter substrate-binding protein [Kaistia dalseonensis]MDQ0439323.1 NitT/TauT family transport system substrate-binding protein [Kaistia dalseonensis]
MNDAPLTTIRIRLLWHPQAQFAGYLIAEHEALARDAGLAIQCVPLDFAKGPIQALLDGDVTFAVASPSHMLESGRADELVFLAAIQQTSSLVYPARRSAGIEKPTDLAGHKLGVWPGREDLELTWMLHRAGLSVDAYERVPVGDTVAAMLDRSVDCAQMTTYHEIHHLEHASGSLDDFVLFKAADYDASLLKDGLIARRDWVAAHPAETQAVIDAVLTGWTKAFHELDAAIELCSKLRPDMSRLEHEGQLGDIRALSLTGATLTEGLGFPDPRHVTQALIAMSEVEGHAVGDAAGLVDDRFWRAAPEAVRGRSW